MFGEFEIREMPLSLAASRQKAEEFLSSQGLRMEKLDHFYGIFDTDDRLVGGGGIKGSVIKCIALSEKTRGESLSNTLVSCIREAAAAEGIYDLTLFTKPENEEIFRSLAFNVIGRAQRAILMESNPRGIKRYTDSLRKIAAPYSCERNGVIVMNCNPLTRGHLYLIEQAASRCGHLFIMPVKDGPTEFSYDERLQALRQAATRFDNVSVCLGSIYTISQATFPTYFLKNLDDAAPTQMELDLDIFARHIAPALGVGIRFVGSEPTDALTGTYNESMHRLLPQRGIEVMEIQRLEQYNIPISASRARRYIKEGKARKALEIVAQESIPAVLARAACAALTKELELTPKPGLVDLHDNGSHSDMNPELMRKSIDACRPYFRQMACAAMSLDTNNLADISQQLRSIGLEAERSMLDVTGGVNTHRGALYSLGLAVAAAAATISLTNKLTAENLREYIIRFAASLHNSSDASTASHGSEACRKFGLKGASDLAREGYEMLFNDWLVFYSQVKDQPLGRHRLLCRIMATIDDTNLYHRGGEAGAAFAKSLASQLTGDCSEEKLAQANADFVKRNLSPGGAADMLALTLFVHSLLSVNDQ